MSKKAKKHNIDTSQPPESKSRSGRQSIKPAGTRSSIVLSDEGGRIVVQRIPQKTLSKTSFNRVGSVDCVTVSQFNLLKDIVMDLQRLTHPVPMPTMPDNKKLIDDVAAGSASLTDTMEAMKVVSRVQAMEEAVTRLSDMMNTLASSVGPDFKLPKSEYGGISQPSSTSVEVPCVTREELERALYNLRGQLGVDITNLTNQVTFTAESATNSGKLISDKIEAAVTVSDRIKELNEIVHDYYTQLQGFDEGLQLNTYQDQMNQLQANLEDGIILLNNVNNNKETLAVMELTERYDVLAIDLDTLLHHHGQIETSQSKISDELRELIRAVETLTEQKADHDEVYDGLKDKADLSQLAGLLTDKNFCTAMDELRYRLDICHEKFIKQDTMWTEAIGDLSKALESKADYLQVHTWRDHSQKHLNELLCLVQLLAKAVGEPKAALITRQMCKDATCGACAEPALMDPEENKQLEPPPPTLPEDYPCLTQFNQMLHKQDIGDHFCNRWVGGSHTLMTPGIVTRGPAAMPEIMAVRPTRRYVDQGANRRMYFMEHECNPCENCNVSGVAGAAGGDAGTSEQVFDDSSPTVIVEYIEQ